MSLTREQAAQELRRRGLPVPGEEHHNERMYEPQSQNNLSREEAIAELKRRGLPIPGEEDTGPGFKGVAKDIWKGVKEAPSGIMDMIEALPRELYGAGEQLFTEPTRIAKNAVHGLANMGHGILNTPANIADYAAEKGFLPKEYADKVPRQQEYDFSQMLKLGEKKPGDALISGLVEYMPFLLGGEAGLAKGVKRAGQRAGAAGLHAVTQNENPVKAALQIAGVEGGLKAVGAGSKAAYKGTKNAISGTAAEIASRFGRKMTPEELAEKLRISEGTQTPLGDVIESPFLKKNFENTIAPRWGSGSEEIFGDIVKDIQNKGDTIVNKMGGAEIGRDPNLAIKELAESARSETGKVKNDLYNQMSKTAEAEGFSLDLPSFTKLASDNAKAIADSPLLKSDSKFKSLYNKLTGLKNNKEITPENIVKSEILDSSGRPVIKEVIPEKIKTSSISDANMIANTLYNEGARMLKSPNASDRAIGNLYKNLSSTLRKDVEKSIMTKGSETLKAEAKSAKDFYKSDFVKFLDKDIHSLLQEGKNPESIIQEIIRPSKVNDKASRIEKFKEILPESQKDLLGYSYLKRAYDKDGIIQPHKVKQLVDALGKRQFKALFTKEQRGQISDYNKLVKMNSEASSSMFNAKTGQRNTQALNTIIGAIAGGAGNSVGGPLGAMLGVAALPAAAKLLTKMATSETFRNSVINKKIKRAIKAEAKAQKPHPIEIFLDKK